MLDSDNPLLNRVVFAMSQVPVHEVVEMAVVKAIQQLPGQAPEICRAMITTMNRMKRIYGLCSSQIPMESLPEKKLGQSSSVDRKTLQKAEVAAARSGMKS